jgi:hypothetical protein
MFSITFDMSKEHDSDYGDSLWSRFFALCGAYRVGHGDIVTFACDAAGVDNIIDAWETVWQDRKLPLSWRDFTPHGSTVRTPNFESTPEAFLMRD